MSETINVKNLDKVDDLKEGDTLLLLRTADDGTQTAYRIEGSDFRGEDAYTVAVKAGYNGTREAWEEQCTKVADFSIEYDPDNGSIVITK